MHWAKPCEARPLTARSNISCLVGSDSGVSMPSPCARAGPPSRACGSGGSPYDAGMRDRATREFERRIAELLERAKSLQAKLDEGEYTYRVVRIPRKRIAYTRRAHTRRVLCKKSAD